MIHLLDPEIIVPATKIITAPWIWIQASFPFPIFPASCKSIDEFLTPTADNNTTGWTTTPLWSKLAVDTNDVISESSLDNEACPSKHIIDFELAMSNPVGEPGPSDCQGMRVVVSARKETNGGSLGECDICIRLEEVTTNRTVLRCFNDIGDSFNQVTDTLTDAEVDLVGNHDNLNVFIEARVCGDVIDTDDIQCVVRRVRVEYFTK